MNRPRTIDAGLGSPLANSKIALSLRKSGGAQPDTLRDIYADAILGQCQLLSLTRSGLYYQLVGETAEILAFVEITRCPAGYCTAMLGRESAVPGNALYGSRHPLGRMHAFACRANNGPPNAT